MNTNYIDELIRKKRVGKIINLLKINVHNWSVSDFKYVYVHSVKNKLYDIFYFIMEFFNIEKNICDEFYDSLRYSIFAIDSIDYIYMSSDVYSIYDWSIDFDVHYITKYAIYRNNNICNFRINNSQSIKGIDNVKYTMSNEMQRITNKTRLNLTSFLLPEYVDIKSLDYIFSFKVMNMFSNLSNHTLKYCRSPIVLCFMNTPKMKELYPKIYFL